MAHEPTDVSLREAIRSLGHNLGKLLSEHVALLQVEFKREGARLAVVAMRVGVGLLLACSGYLVLMGALVALLVPSIGLPLAALVIGLLNLGIGGGVVALAVRRLRADVAEPSVLKAELEEDVKEIRESLAARGGSAER